jgi:hypothetical protein
MNLNTRFNKEITEEPNEIKIQDEQGPTDVTTAHLQIIFKFLETNLNAKCVTSAEKDQSANYKRNSIYMCAVCRLMTVKRLGPTPA